MQPRPPLSPFWLTAWAVTLSFCWVLPNHYQPWLAFHSDVWCAVTALLIIFTLFIRLGGAFQVHWIGVLVAGLVALSWIQYLFGLVIFSGSAWVSSLYLIGFLLALLAGSRWESATPGQAADGIFLAIGIASILSVGLQLKQWLAVDGLELWVMGGGADRPHGNLGQPNQLATLLIWGVLAALWAAVRQYISLRVAVFLAGYLLFGVALTGSRSAWIALSVMAMLFIRWRHLWPSGNVTRLVCGLGVFFLFSILGIKFLQFDIYGSGGTMAALDSTVRTSTEIRPVAWQMFLVAIKESPWVGYGWDQIVIAQATLADAYPPLNGVFRYAHNMFLDLVLWFGIPIGLVAISSICYWLFCCFKNVKNFEDAILVALFAVVVVHSMFEMPLYYAYFLLPFGILAGSVNVRLVFSPVIFIGVRSVVTVAVFMSALLALVVEEYVRIESSHYVLRLDWENIEHGYDKAPPNLVFLNQWYGYFKLARFDNKTAANEEMLSWMRQVTMFFPNPDFYMKLATQLANNNRFEEASVELERMCNMVPHDVCVRAKKAFRLRASKSDGS